MTLPNTKADQKRFDEKYGECDIVFVPLDFSVPSARIRKKVEDIVQAAHAIADFGCGHGGTPILFARLNPRCRVYGLDYSGTAIRKARTLSPTDSNLSFRQIDFTEADAKSVLPESVDFAYTSQVIEHVEDEDDFVRAIVRCTKPGGFVYVGTVFKKPYAWYFYRNSKNERVIETTHVREYTDVHQLFDRLEAAGLRVLDYDLRVTKYPIIDIPLKILSKYCRGPRVFRLLNSFLTMWLRRLLVIPIPGYYVFQVLALKPDEAATT